MKRLIVGCMLLGSSLFGSDFLPLQSGNIWVYRESATGQMFSVTVGLPYLINNQMYQKLSGYTNEPLLVRQDEQGQLLYLDEERRQEFILSSLVPFEGGWWHAPFRTCEQEGQTLNKRGVFDGAAGPFHDVLEVRYRTFGCADAGTQSEQYAENIGMVRRVVSSFAGPKQFDLVYAKVGGLLIDALPNARFSVTASWTKGSSNIAVTMRMQTNSDTPLKLSFPTAQEFDVVLRDADGRSLWRWSDGQFFGQTLHERQVGREWSLTVLVPKPAGTGPAPRNYTVQGWLTTSGEAPQFASTVPLSITGQ